MFKVRGCVPRDRSHGRVILGKGLNVYIILKLVELGMTWKRFLLREKIFNELRSVKCEKSDVYKCGKFS